jgi:hypothetical protein
MLHKKDATGLNIEKLTIPITWQPCQSRPVQQIMIYLNLGYTVMAGFSLEQWYA